MQLQSIHAGNFKLDGGAMFGVVPKTIWNKLNPADENNMCNWAMRCLLVEDGNRLILIDNGIGDKQSEKFFSHYFLNGPYTLQSSLHAAGVDFSDITDVVLTHLHFDHCGGSVKRSGESLVPAFPRARYWSHKSHWEHALSSNPREKASFLHENFVPLQESGQLQFVGDNLQISEQISVFLVNGHTEKMMCPLIRYKEKTIAYMADLIPSAAHIPPNYVMSYDIRPLDTMRERQEFLQKAVENEWLLFFEHDLNNEMASVHLTEKGYRMDQALHLKDIL